MKNNSLYSVVNGAVVLALTLVPSVLVCTQIEIHKFFKAVLVVVFFIVSNYFCEKHLSKITEPLIKRMIKNENN